MQDPQPIRPGDFVRHISHPNTEGYVASLDDLEAVVRWPAGPERHPLAELQLSGRERMEGVSLGHSTPG